MRPLPGRKAEDYTSQARVNIKQVVQAHFKMQAPKQFSVEKRKKYPIYGIIAFMFFNAMSMT